MVLTAARVGHLFSWTRSRDSERAAVFKGLSLWCCHCVRNWDVSVIIIVAADMLVRGRRGGGGQGERNSEGEEVQREKGREKEKKREKER